MEKSVIVTAEYDRESPRVCSLFLSFFLFFIFCIIAKTGATTGVNAGIVRIEETTKVHVVVHSCPREYETRSDTSASSVEKHDVLISETTGRIKKNEILSASDSPIEK